jgi:hypothetical protein
MNRNTIFVDKTDIETYFNTSRGRTNIDRIRKALVNEMPKEIKEEFRTKFNDLVEIAENKYQFKAFDCSERLARFFNQYLIQVTD